MIGVKNSGERMENGSREAQLQVSERSNDRNEFDEQIIFYLTIEYGLCLTSVREASLRVSHTSQTRH